MTLKFNIHLRHGVLLSIITTDIHVYAHDKHHAINDTYRKTSHISRTLVGNKIVDNSDVVGASPVGAAPTIFSFST